MSEQKIINLTSWNQLNGVYNIILFYNYDCVGVNNISIHDIGENVLNFSGTESYSRSTMHEDF